MKNPQQSKSKLPNTPAEMNRKRPEIRDNLDSREGLEQEVKGSDVTHNKKEHRSAPRSGKRDRNK